MDKQLSSIQFLNKHNIAHSVKNFSDKTDKGAENVAKQFNKAPRSFLKSLIFEKQNGELFMTLVGGDQNVDINQLKKVLGGEAKMADPEKLFNELGFRIGSIPPFGLNKKIEVLIEESLQSEKEFGVGSGQWGVEIFISPQDLIAATKGKYVKLITPRNKIDLESLSLDQKYLPRVAAATELGKTSELRNLSELVDKTASFNGWVSNFRSSGKIAFIQFRDGSGDIQVVVEKSLVNEKVWDAVQELTLESSIQITGKIKTEPRSPFGYEMSLTDLKIIQISPEFPISKKEHGPDFLMDNRHLWVRSSKQRAVMQIRDQIFFSMTSFLHEQGFLRVDTPIFQPVSCEDTTELFEVDFFGNPTYLTQSGQLYCEAMEYALGKTYDFGPVFRAEKSKTRKHLIEFWMMDAELPFTDLNGLMDFEAQLLKRLISDCLKYQAGALKVLDRDLGILEHYHNTEFKKIKHKEVIDLLNDKYAQKLTYLSDIGTEEEIFLFQEFDVPVFITDWPAEIKAFYMTKYHDQKNKMDYVRSVDLVVPEGGGELMGGSEREFDYNKLLKILSDHNYPYQDYAWYMDLRKYGTIPHSGFGIGMERTVRWISGIHHIRETIPFPRMINRMYP